jgi:hypothetical protein
MHIQTTQMHEKHAMNCSAEADEGQEAEEGEAEETTHQISSALPSSVADAVNVDGVMCL